MSSLGKQPLQKMPCPKKTFSPLTSMDAKDVLELLRKQIDMNLQHSKHEDAPMTKQDAFTLGQLQYESDFAGAIHEYGIRVKQIFHNESPAVLYEQALLYEDKTYITSTGALAVSSGENIWCFKGQKTGRSPGDKRIVAEPETVDDIWWGKVNIKMTMESYLTNRERAIDFLNTQDRLYVVDAFAGWDPQYRIRIRVITTRAYHALFMENMLVLPTASELKSFVPEFIVYNAGCFPANRFTEGVSSQTCVAMCFSRKEMIILGTQYAGEMKKGILTLIMYALPKLGHLPLHSSCNISPNSGDQLTLFFGLSGTGKTTLSADPEKILVGDDEHVWTDKGIFNVEGGCYAKCKSLCAEKEPDIFDAIRFGTILENVVLDTRSRKVDYEDVSITENTRASYPLHYITKAKIPAYVNNHPSNIILLTCDAFGVLPPVSKLSSGQAMYHFISGYTAKVAGTEHGVTEPVATFSACFGAPFLPFHPTVYAEMLAKKLEQHQCQAWLLNTGWINGSVGKGKRIDLNHTRAMVSAINSGSLVKETTSKSFIFELDVPDACPHVPSEILHPEKSWACEEEYKKSVKNLAALFVENYKKYEDRAKASIGVSAS